MAERPLSYAIVSKPVGNPPVLIGHAVVKCADCGIEEKVSWRQHHNPYHISNHFKNRLNWDFDLYREAKCRCPDCKRKKTFNRTDSELPALDTFGARFRWTREQAHLKRDDISDEAGINRDLLEFLEAGKQSVFNLDVSSINKLIDVLNHHGVNVDRDWLLGSSEQAATLARNVKREMERHSITEGALADRARVSLSAIKLILSGTIPMHYKLPDIALALHTTVDDLMGVPTKIDRLHETGRTPPAATPAPNTALPETGRTPPAATPAPNTALPAPAPATQEVFIPIDIPDDATPGERLKAARTRKNMPQARLAEAIYQRTQQWTLQTLKWMMSRLEKDKKDVSGRILVIGIIGEVLGVHPDWLLGRTNEQRPMLPSRPPAPPPQADPAPAEIQAQPAQPPAPDPVSSAVTMTLAEVDDIRRQLELAESTMGELKTMFDDRTAELMTLKELLSETRSSVEAMKARLGITTVVLPSMVPVAPVESPPMEATEIPPITPPAILVEGGQTHERATDVATNGHDPQEVSPSGGRIDRSLDTKQNAFARSLIRKVRNEYLTIDVIKKRLRTVLDDLVPAGSNEDVYIHALMRRETIADNGVLAKVGRGVWQYRDNAHI